MESVMKRTELEKLLKDDPRLMTGINQIDDINVGDYIIVKESNIPIDNASVDQLIGTFPTGQKPIDLLKNVLLHVKAIDLPYIVVDGWSERELEWCRVMVNTRYRVFKKLSKAFADALTTGLSQQKQDARLTSFNDIMKNIDKQAKKNDDEPPQQPSIA